MRVRSIADLPFSMQAKAAAQLRPVTGTAVKAGARNSKFRNKAWVVDDQRFDSKLEWRCYEWLKQRHAEGEVLWFVRQAPFILEGGVRYRADFLVVLAGGGVEVLDAKGFDTQASRNKRRQVRARYGVTVRTWPK